MLSISVFDNGVIHYLSFPIGYRMWTKEETKLDMAADMIREVMDIIGHERNVCLCCDSWYPKGEITELPQQYDNLALICNVRHDTALYDLPPAKTGKKGRPRVRGQKLSFDNFEFSPVEGTDYSVGTLYMQGFLLCRTLYHPINYYLQYRSYSSNQRHE